MSQSIKHSIRKAKEIPESPTADVKADRAVFYSCIEYYNSKELDRLIKSMQIRK